MWRLTVLLVAGLALPACFQSEGCPDVWNPVCGSDGETYPNACLAERAGVGVELRGACPDTPGVCTGDTDCAVGYLCELSTGSCLACACDETDAPVCGRDRATYESSCEAECAHVAVRHPGECGGSCFPWSCPTGSYCGDIEMYCHRGHEGAARAPCVEMGFCIPDGY